MTNHTYYLELTAEILASQGSEHSEPRLAKCETNSFCLGSTITIGAKIMGFEPIFDKAPQIQSKQSVIAMPPKLLHAFLNVPKIYMPLS